jgi:hypothetical protein
MGEGWIHTGRLRLRKLAEGDLDDLVALDADPDVMRYINGGQPTPRQTYVDGVLARMLAYDHPRIGFFAAVSSEADAAGRFLGWFHLRPSVAPGAGADTLARRGAGASRPRAAARCAAWRSTSSG